MSKPDKGRRAALKLLGSATVLTAAGPLVTVVGCAGGDSATEQNRVVQLPLEELPLGQRVRVLNGPDPIEVVRNEDGVRARSLWCTHSGCEVKWNEEEGRYFCPCHEGVYDANGRPIKGPPPRSLKEYPMRVSGSTLFLGESEPAG